MKDFQLSFTTLADCKDKLSKLFVDNPKGKYRITLTKWTKKRSISMNRQQHLWYNQIAKHNEDQCFEDAKSFCKLTFGLPILLNSEVHGDFYEALLLACNFWNQEYETRLMLMHGIEVTSKFNTAEAKEYAENMIFYFNDVGIPIKYKD